MEINWNWNLTEEEIDEFLYNIQEEYAKKVAEYIQSLPEKFQRTAYYESLRVEFSICHAIGGIGWKKSGKDD